MRLLVGSQLAPAAAESRPRLVVHREFAPGQQAHFGHRIEASLRIRIEGADRVDLVVEQVDAVRHGRSHREQVDQAAAHRVFAGADDLRDVVVAGQRELRLEPGLVQLLLHAEVEGVAGQEARRCHTVERGARRHQHHVGLPLQDPPQRREPLADQVLVRREGVVRQRLPVREEGAAQFRREEGDLVQQALGVVGICGDDGGEAAVLQLPLRHAGEQQRVGRAGRARQGHAAAGGKLG
jgi:hypothetical protein